MSGFDKVHTLMEDHIYVDEHEYLALAPLQHFDCEVTKVSFPDDVEIRRMSMPELNQIMELNQEELDRYIGIHTKALSAAEENENEHIDASTVVSEFCVMSGKQVFVRDATGLVREFSTFDGFNLAFAQTNILIGLYAYSWIPVGYPGANSALGMLVAGPLVVLVGVIYGAMSNAMPRSGGDYIWVSRVFNPAVGFVQSFYLFWVCLFFTAVQCVWISTWFVSTWLTYMGMAATNAGLTSLGTQVAAPVGTFIVSSILLIYAFTMMVLGPRVFGRMQKVLFVVVNAGMVTLFALCFSVPSSVFASNLNQYLIQAGSTATYESILQSAKQTGYASGWLILPTVMALPYTFTTFGGYNWTSYVGGEVRNARNRMSWTIVPTAIVSVICFAIMGFAIYHLTGFDFFNGLQWVYYLKPSAYPSALILPPCINYFIFFATKNSALVFFILFAYVLDGLWIVPCLPLFMSRIWFAWSFDRVLPSKLADVSERFHVPLYIIGLEALFSFIVLYGYVFTSWFTFAVNIYMGWMISYTVVGLAIALFYWKKRALFETTLSTVYKRKIGGIPLLSILGAAMFCAFAFMIYACATNAAIGGPISWASFTEGVAGPFILAVIIFYASSIYHKRKGVDISLAFAEIPPE